MDKALSTFGKLDILVNCAAGNFLALPENLSVKGFKTVMEIDTVGVSSRAVMQHMVPNPQSAPQVFNMCHESFPALQASGRATIINISAMFQRRAAWYQVCDCLLPLRHSVCNLVHAGSRNSGKVRH